MDQKMMMMMMMIILKDEIDVAALHLFVCADHKVGVTSFSRTLI